MSELENTNSTTCQCAMTDEVNFFVCPIHYKAYLENTFIRKEE